MGILRWLWVASGVCLLISASQPGLAQAPSERCDTETLQTMAPPATTVSFAAREQGGCRAVGYVTTQNPGPNKVLFVLGLPDNFNGDYVYLGVGGAAGQLPTLRPGLLAKGYAVAGSDGGTGAKNGADFSFMKDPAKSADMHGRAVHVSAGATEQIARTYYKRDSMSRYIAGCSGGGSMGLTNALRYGREDFDGFVVGATPWPGDPYMPNVFHLAQYLQKHPEGWLPPELMARADAAILAAYDGSDGATDGIIADARDIDHFDLDLLRQTGFTPAQIETFEVIHGVHEYSGPGLPPKSTHPGYPVSNVSSWSAFLLGTKPPPWPETDTRSASEIASLGAPYIHIMADTMTRAAFPGRNYADISDPTELSKVAQASTGPDLADFSKLAASGAKLIVYHGVNDQAMSYLETVASRQTVVKNYPDASRWLRVFTVPGLMHCAGGPGPTDVEDRLLDAVSTWVEHDQTPDTVVTNRFTPAKGLERTFRLCAEPARAKLKSATLDPKQADNWECKSSSGEH
jgi:tannase/feruloyl esterase